MQNDLLASLRRLSDTDLASRVKELAARARDATAELVAHLAELATRDLHPGSPWLLFRLLPDALAPSGYHRVEAARAARRFPAILGMLAEGSLNLTSVKLLAPHLTSDNHARVLEAARGKRKSQVEEIVAGLWPQPDPPSGSLTPRPCSPRHSSQPGPPAGPLRLVLPR
jgi:hypothetical protein